MTDVDNAEGTAAMDGPSLRVFEWAILDSNQRPLPCEVSATSVNVCHELTYPNGGAELVGERFSSFADVVLDRCWTVERSAGRFPGVRLLWTLQQCRLRKTLKSSSTRRCRNYLSNSAIVCSALPPSISPAWLHSKR